MNFKFEKFEVLLIALCLLFTLVISNYHLSWNGYLGLSQERWDTIWAIFENGFSLLLCLIIIIFSYGAIRKLFKFIFIKIIVTGYKVQFKK